jgi:SAM-dependent methyltransferase
MNTVLSDKQGNRFEMKPWVCPTCGPGPTTTLGMRGGRYQREGLGVETAIVSCQSCGLLFPNPFPVPENAQKLYGDPDAYFAQHDLETKVQAYRALVRSIRSRVHSPTFKLLDIGAGRGDLIQAARLEGSNDAMGLEFSQAMIRFAKEHFGIELLDQTAESFAKQHPQSFDAVVLNAVLEHVYDPRALVEAAAQLCKPGAVFYVDVPREPHLLTSVASVLNRLRGDPAVLNLAPTWSPFHVYGFNPRALTVLLTKSGFSVESIRVHASPHVPATPGLRGRVKATIATQVNRVANVIQYSSNMYLYARRL